MPVLRLLLQFDSPLEPDAYRFNIDILLIPQNLLGYIDVLSVYRILGIIFLYRIRPFPERQRLSVVLLHES